MDIGKTLLWVFMILAVLSLLVSLFTGKGPRVMLMLLTFGAGLMASGIIPSARAEETVGEKIENAGGDAKKDTKKSWRKAKRKHRKATGANNVGKDIKDSAEQAGDEVGHGAKKIKRKAD